MTNIVFFAKLDKVYREETMTAVQTGVQEIENWNHFNAGRHLHLQMETKFLPHVSILFAAILLAWYFDTFDFGLFKYTSKKKGDAVDELLKKKHQVIGKECIPDTNTCFLIVDSFYLENGRLTTKRDLLLEENTEYSLTGVEVESTKPVSFDNLNSRDWAVNKVVINSRYARLLVASGFIMESLTFDENDHHDVLIAGLGGGVMSNFLSEISYLNIDTTVVENEEFIISIAENYFGHAETNEMRVVHADVVDFLRKYDKKYDVIIVDACENKKSDVMCPVSNILKKETVQLLKKRLTRNGSLAVNVYITQNAAKTEKEILELFSNEFNSCFFLEYFKDKKFREALFRFFRDRPPVEDHFLDLRVRILQIYAGVGNFQFRVDMLNQQQHNQAAPQLLNVQRPHQIQPPSQHRIAPQGQGMQQNQMQQGQNMGQPQMQQQQRSVIQSGPSTSQQMQPQQGQMMNMGQQMRQHQNQPQQQQQMMHNPQQPQQMQRNPQQQQMRNVPQQGQQMQHQQQQQPQMAQMRTQQNQQNMNVPQQQPQQQQQRMPVQNMQQNQQGMRMVQPQTQQQPRMQAPPQQHQQMQQQGGNQNMNRPSPQPMQMQQGGQQNINRPPSQQMQHAQPQTVNRPAPHMNNMPVLNQIMSRPPLQLPPVSQTAASQQLYRTQQMQLIQQRMNSESPQQSQQQMHQEQQNVNGQQQMQMQQQHRDPQMQHGQSPVNEAQHQVQVAQVPPKQQNVQPQQRLQMPPQQQQNIRGPVHNSPQNQQMRMAQPQQHQQNRNQQHQQNQQQQPPQQQGHQNQPIRPAPQMVQNRQIAPNQRQQQQLQQQQSLPMQQQNIQQPVQQQPMHQQVHQQQQIQQPQPIHRPQPMKQEQPQVSQANTFEPDNGQTIRINGEHAIINGLQYKLIQLPQSLSPQGQMQHGQQSHQNHQQTPPGQHMQQVPQQQAPNMQQRGQNNQMPVHQPQQQLLQHQQNVPNQQMTPNQQNRQNQPNQHNQQNQQHQSNMPNQQTPPALQQQQAPPSKSSKPRSRSKKASGGNSTPSLHHNTPTADSPSNQRLTPNNNSNMMPSTSSAVPIKSGRKILPPELTPLNAQTPPHNQNESMLRSDSPQQPRMVQQGKHQVQVGGYPPNRDMITPVKSETRNRTPTKMSVHPNQRSGGRSRALQPSSRIRPPGNKVSLMEIQEAIAEHIKGIRKMTPEYEQFVEDELERLLCEMEILELTEDRRYYAVQRLIVLCRGDNVSTIKTPEKEPRCDQQAPTEEEIVEPIDETPEKRKSRYDGYMEKLKEAYPPTTHNAQVCGVDEETIRKETMFYREQDMQEREAYLRKNVDKLPKDKQTKAKIEYLGISLRDFQNQVRKDVLATTTLVPPTEFLINPWSIRRTKNEYMQELRQHPDRAILEKKRKTVNFVFLQSLAKHTREFKEFHKRNLVNHTKVRKSMQTYITNEAKRVAREEMKNEKNRIQKLIQEDEEGYRAMLDEKKDRRLVYLLEQTDDYIKSLCDLLKQQQSNTAGNSMVKHTPRKNYDGLAEEDKVKSILDKARNDEDEYENKAAKMNIEDYYATAHGVREVITEQHSTMGGGNPTLKLKPYQLKGLEWMVSLYNNNLNGILADEMGLGKTIQTIAFITYMMEIKKNSGPFLVIVPLSTIPNWKNEFEKWAPDVHMIVYKGTKDVRKFHEPAIKAAKFNVLLTTFEYVIREKGLLGKLRWKYMMIDEGHRLKNQHCKLTEMLNTRFQCQRRLLITGTPLQNKLPELWALLNFLLPSIFSSCSTFEQWFNAPFATTGEKVELTGEETMLIIRRLHKVLRPFLLRRLKKEVESELPDKMEFVIKCEMSGLQKVLYKHMQKGLLLDGKTNTGSRSLMNTMVHLRKLCNHPFLFENVEDSCKAYWDSKFISAVDLYRVSGKLELLDRILPKLHATGHRVLMFFQMTAMMTVVEDYLAGTSINYLRLDGSTKPDDRGLLLDKFNAPNSKYFLFMLSTRAGGLGLNLQTADTVVIFDSDWNPHQDMQAQDRAHRIGQKAEVRVFRLITANSVEEKILASARFKLNVDEKVIQAGKFDNRSTGAERKQILEQIIKAENESDEDEDVPNDEEINDILSRSEEEFETFQKMDQNRYDHDKRINAKPRLCGDDEIPKDILRAADETDCIEKAKEEGLVTHMEVMPGSRRSRKEVDYSIDTMSDDKFLEKLFDGDDATSSKPEQQPVETPEPKPAKPALKLASPQPGPSSETPKRVVSETPAAPEAFVTPKLPPLTFKVPKLLIKSVEELNRKHKLSEGDSSDLSSRKTLKLDDEEKEKEEDYALKRKSFPPIGKIKIKFGGEQFEKLLTMNDETTPPTKTDEKEKKSRKEEKSRKRRNEDGSTPKKRKHRDQDGEGSSEKKKKHKHKHHEHDDELSTSSVQTPSPLFPLKIRVKPMSESPLKSNDSSSSTMSTPSLDKTSSEESFQTPGLGFPLKIRVKPMNESPLKSYDSDFSSKSAPSLDESPVLGLPLKIRVKPMAESSVKSQESDSSTKSAQRLDKSPSKSKRKHDDDSKSHQKKSRKHDEDSPAKPRSKKKRDSDSSSKSDQKKEPLFPLKIRVKPFDESLLKSQESDSSSKSAEKHNEESLSHKKLDTESPLKIRIKPIIDDVFLNTPETDSSSKSAKKHHDSKSKSHRKHDEGSSLTSPKKPEMENPLKIRIKPIIDDSSLKTPETDSSSKSAEKGHHSSSKSHRKHEESSSSHKKPVTETPLKIRVKPIIDDPYQMIVDRETSKSLEQLNESHRKNDEPSSTSSHKKPSMEAPLKIRVKPIIDDPYQRIVDAESSKPAEKLEESHRKHEDPSLASSHKKPSMEAPLKIRVKPIIDDPYQRIVDAELSKSVEKLTESSHHSHTKPAMESPVKIRVKPIIDDSTLKTPETDSSSKTPEKVKESSSKSHRKHGDGSSHKSHKDKNKDSSKMSDHEQDKEFPFKIRIKPIDDSALTSETRESPVKTVENTGETLSKSQPQKEAVLSKPEQKTDVPLKKHNQEPSMTSATSEPSSETTKKLEESPPKPALDTSNEPLPKFTFKLNNSLPLKEASEPSTSSMEPAASQPTLKLKLNFKLPTAEPITSVNGAEPKSDEPKKESNEKTETPKKEKEHKKHHKDKKEHKEHKKKSREGETEEERRARKEAKRLKHQKSGQDDDVKRQEKAARKAARKEQKRLDKEKLAAGSVIQEAVQQDSIAQETPNQEAVAQPAAGSA